jgi:uncharacterized protein YdeI (YjbR/CyaY-like superfamily)
MEPKPDEPVVPFANVAEFDAWLAANHKTARVVWARQAKKASGIPSITWDEAVDVALCWGWIDGQRQALDETWFLQRFTPRGVRSRWSKINRDRIARLVAEGRMQPAGLAEVARAKADGRWEAAYDSAKTATVPDDLAAALDATPGARASFDGLNAATRFSVLYRVQDAKRPETRKRRIESMVAALGRGESPVG